MCDKVVFWDLCLIYTSDIPKVKNRKIKMEIRLLTINLRRKLWYFRYIARKEGETLKNLVVTEIKREKGER